MKRTILSICGGSGSGKSVLAKHLVEQLGADQAARVPTDYFLHSNPYPSLAEFFQHPLQVDWDLLEAALGAADGTLLTTPNYDFVRFQRVSTHGGLPFVLRPVMILDAMLPYARADITVLLRCPEEERKRRIEERDLRWKTRVIDYWALHQVTLAEMMRGDFHADLILDGTDSLEDNAGKILALARLLPEADR